MVVVLFVCEGSGSFIVFGVGGMGVYVFVWSDGQFGVVVVGFDVGIYIVIFIDVNDCEVIVDFELL